MKYSIIPIVLALGAPTAFAAPEVIVTRAPGGGIQPVAEADAGGNVHLVYFRGEAAHGNLFHSVRPKGAKEFGKPVRINSIDGSGIAVGTIRGAQMALGRDGHVHVAWMGSSKTRPEKDHHATPMLYARSTDGGKSFEKERNLITKSYGLDGGGAIAANGTGRVEVFWHAGKQGGGETGRQIWVTRSDDDGKTFTPEVAAWNKNTGVCGCCGMTAGSAAGKSFVLYRSATEGVNRDIYLLSSGDGKSAFSGKQLDRWSTEMCPMSAMSLSSAGARTAAAWEAKGGDVAFTVLGTGIRGGVAHGKEQRKYPDIALAPDGHVLLAWIDGGGWKKNGKLAWQLFDPEGKPIGEPKTVTTSAVWTKPAAVYANGSFLIIH